MRCRPETITSIKRTWSENQVFQSSTETENVMKKNQDSGQRHLDVLRAEKDK